MAEKQAPKQHHNLIQSYGLFWDRCQVDWRSGPLLGRVKVRDKPVDFRDQLGIYALYDHEFRLLYVGQAGSGKNTLFGRLKHHTSVHAGTRALAARWKYFSWFGLLRVLKVEKKGEKQLASRADTKQTTEAHILNALEAAAIEIADPDLNRQGGRLRNVTEYVQVLRKEE